MTDKEILKGFKEQFLTGRLFTESQVLVLMGYARGDARKLCKAPQELAAGSYGYTTCDACGMQDTEECSGCTLKVAIGANL